MITANGLNSVAIWITGEQSLLSIAKYNLLNNLERINKISTHTFLDKNAQTEFGISHNFGALRHYCWEDTMVDCRHAHNLTESDALRDMVQDLSAHSRFQCAKETIETRMNHLVTLEPFTSVQRGEENMRYNIRRNRKIEDFDIIRVGFKLSARDEVTFKQALQAMSDADNPFKNIKQPHRILEPA